MTLQPQLFIDAISFVEFDGETSLPTVVFYTSREECVVGREAIDKESLNLHANRDFKLGLGATSIKTTAERRPTFPTAGGGYKTAFNISQSFCLNVLARAQEWARTNGLSAAGNLLVAEPLQFYVDEHGNDWLQNYRYYMRAILSPYFSDINFMPEPFAVFQYYRIGKRHPSVEGRKKYVALVLDFGGGTFDSSVIETTKNGDLPQSGSNAKPFAASSAPIGGGFVDTLIAQYCMTKALAAERSKKQLRQIFRKIPKWDDKILPDLSDTNKAVYSWLQYTKQKAEHGKIILCRAVTDWSLEKVQDIHVDINIPTDPFRHDSSLASVTLSAKEFQDLFCDEIWQKHLYGAVKSALRRAEHELDGRTVNLLLLSGGSCNIGWVERLIAKDFPEALRDAEPLSLASDFQTIVAQGLAAECARRYSLNTEKPQSHGVDIHAQASPTTEKPPAPQKAQPATEPNPSVRAADGHVQLGTEHEMFDTQAVREQITSDFDGVSYNSLSLALCTDEDTEFKLVRLRPWSSTKNTLSEGPLGVVLGSGTMMRALVNRTLTWKLDVRSSPRRRLNYYFVRGNQPIPNMDDVYNVLETHIDTGGFRSFGGHIWLELQVMEDGTCKPQFVYKRDNSGLPEVVRPCVPFALDSTDFGAIVPAPPNKAISTEGSAAINSTTRQSATYNRSDVDAAEPEHAMARPSGALNTAFFGFDFGSTNSAVSYISKASIQITKRRSADYQWGSLRDSVEKLPAPVAHAAAHYLAPRTSVGQSHNALVLFEAAYAFMAYLVYSESRLLGVSETHLLKKFRHRSAGPLIELLSKSVGKVRGRASLVQPIVDLEATLIGGSTEVIRELNDLKHDKRENLSKRTERFCEQAALCVAHVLDNKYFGRFKDVEPAPFSTGSCAKFEIVAGTSLYLESISCTAEFVLIPNVPYVIDKLNGRSICMAPLMMFGLAGRPEEVWIYDGPTLSDGWSFKSTSRNEVAAVSAKSHPDLWRLLSQLTQVDGPHRADLNGLVSLSDTDS